MQCEKRASYPEISKKETSQRAAAIDPIKTTFDQPTEPRRFVVTEDSGGRDSFHFLFHIFRKLNRRQSFANWHFTVRRRFVAFKHGRIDAEWADINSFRVSGADAAIRDHMHA